LNLQDYWDGFEFITDSKDKIGKFWQWTKIPRYEKLLQFDQALKYTDKER